MQSVNTKAKGLNQNHKVVSLLVASLMVSAYLIVIAAVSLATFAAFLMACGYSIIMAAVPLGTFQHEATDELPGQMLSAMGTPYEKQL